MCAHYFMEGFAELQVAHLRTCILRADYFTIEDISHLYHPVGSASSCGEQTMLMRRPCNSLDGGFMI